MHKLKNLIPQNIKNLYHLAQAILANLIYGFPSKKIKVIGVTGTNGKTTTVQMIAKILEEAGNPVEPGGHGARKVAVASTINFRINGDEEINKTKFTTLSSWAVQKFIKKAIENKCEYLVLETSSHSLDQYRVWGVAYQTAVITNVTREHLDYHKTMEEYRKAKIQLFKKVKTAVVNLDMEKPEEFLSIATGKKVTYSLKDSKADVLAENIEIGIQNTRYKIKDTNFKLNLLGEFNIENALAATAVGLSENIDLKTIAKALEKIKLVPGRMERVINEKEINIIIDYAVTPDSLEKLYELIKSIRDNSPEIRESSKIIAVFGSCGERDRGKRPIMGEIVSKKADFVIVTNEDPYDEDPMQIINEVSEGIKNRIEGNNFWKILDRREAIRKALELAKAGDFVVVTGKGAEETMAVGDKRIPWNDRKVIEEELSK
ncbi:MAG TPA: UDP-N-acetylmuramoyl-L-alanyl-D-glutamate--2,6-diaminopimelate ligase [Candidatus Moranbacteria bacterium]|nr:UDP-N-acetylmuramoyl-L-alanyl-D-glutamate--2,6-diaminopimelate ligase [Candidatus Moranbacteria bacterium]HSA08203.1 UDP-N-acetylmuramoyl-L-alanyl-D-glutamate--2,6-diaminopimelate ligase [Candidatus Moranbacteria bacterium]